MRIRRLALPLVAAAALLAGCGGGSGSTLPPDFDGPVIAADDLAFDRAELAVPAGAAFRLGFDNRESAPHNVAIYTDDTLSESRFKGEVFGGPATRVYDVPALEAGDYYFQCDVHPEMRGTVIAGGG